MFGTHAICCSGVVQLGVHVECNSMFESMQLRRQICGGGNCGAGQLCSFGINSESQMPGLPESDPNQGQFQLSLMVA